MRTLALVVLAFCINGCAIAIYQDPNGTRVTYKRFMTSADSIKCGVGDAKVQVGGQKIDASIAQSILSLLGAAAK